jgi:hypothetical protein
MGITIPRHVVYDLATGRVLRWGHCKFHIESAIEGMIESEFIFDPPIEPRWPDITTGATWYWNGETFVQTAP